MTLQQIPFHCMKTKENDTAPAPSMASLSADADKLQQTVRRHLQRTMWKASWFGKITENSYQTKVASRPCCWCVVTGRPLFNQVCTETLGLPIGFPYLRMGHPIAFRSCTVSCDCGSPLDDDGFHLLTSKTGGVHIGSTILWSRSGQIALEI